MNRNIALILSYDGTAYLGWQKNRTGPSIESALEAALETILNHPIVLQAASRTDAGVHAEGQVVNFLTGNSIDLGKLLVGVNALLPKDIAVTKIKEERLDFHPTLQCRGKEYHYRICYNKVQSPLQRLYEWHIPSPLDLTQMKNAASDLVGIHNFEAFCNVRKNLVYSSYEREVSCIEIESISCTQLLIKITGRNFLYKMVRNIVGTLVYIGRGKLKCEEIPGLLQKRDRTLIGVTAPAHGLCLAKVFYVI